MNQLEQYLKHYLGTGLRLKCKVPPHYSEFEIEAELLGMTAYQPKTYHVQCYNLLGNKWRGKNALLRSEIKPIMHRLSSIDKPITVDGYNDGKEFIPIIELFKIGTGEKHTIHEDFYTEFKSNFYWLVFPQEGLKFAFSPSCGFSYSSGYRGQALHLGNQFQMFEFIFKCHVWPFDQSLFDKGLIIDKATL